MKIRTGTAIKKPIPVEFCLLTKDTIKITYEFIHGKDSVRLNCRMAEDRWDDYENIIIKQGYMELKTLESGQGSQHATIGDYILKGIDGECWPIKPDIFERTYTIQN